MNVIMLHSVGNHNSSWHQNWLSVSLEHFEEFCKFLKNEKYETLLLKDWYELQNYPQNINKKQIVLTFDDGYLDNLVFAYPILKKYNLRGTIFINPEFVDPSTGVRPTIEMVWNKKVQSQELNSLGFLNWDELKFLDQSGVMDIQSHSMSHNYYFYSDKLINFYQGQKEFHWLAWIFKKDRKAFWLNENQTKFVPFGYPIFEYGRALGLKRFIPSEKFVNSFIEETQNIRTDSEIEKLKKLSEFIEKYKETNGLIGDFESDEEVKNRYSYELFDSKKILENKLLKKIDFLCWPGGGYNEISLDVSEKAGYLASTIASKEKHIKLDNSKQYKRIQRFGLSSFVKYGNKKIYNKNKKALIHIFQKRNNGFGTKVFIKLIQIKDRILY